MSHFILLNFPIRIAGSLYLYLFIDPVPVKRVDNPFAVQRPKATNDMLFRQGSFRGFEKLQESSPFKRTTSLRLNDLPSTLQRQNAVSDNSPPRHPGAGMCNIHFHFQYSMFLILRK